MQQGELSSVIYTNLPVGSYTFHLAVLDSKDQSVQVESTYQIIKKAEIYDNWWFMLYMVCVFADRSHLSDLACDSIHRYRER